MGTALRTLRVRRSRGVPHDAGAGGGADVCVCGAVALRARAVARLSGKDPTTMDPNANLIEQKRCADAILRAVDTDTILVGDAIRLAELVLALDEWLQRGGFLPTAWQAGR